MMDKSNVHTAAWWLVWIGGINWGLIGAGGFMGQNWNVIDLILGRWPQIEWIVYILVGVSAVLLLMKDKKMMKM